MTLPRSGLGSTSLGAVGGPRGVAAGGLRILIEFISQYDPQAVKQLEADLTELQGLQDKFGDRQIRLTDRLNKVTEKQIKARNTLLATIKNLDKAEAAAASRRFKAIEAGLAIPGQRRADAKKDLQLFVQELQKSGALTAAEAKNVARLVALETQRRSLATQLNNAKKTAVGISEQQVAVETQLGRFAALRQQLPSRLGGLAVGALGGLVGGALIGAGFAAAQAVIDRVGESIQDLLDPSRHAREAIKELGEEVSKIADQQDITQLQALKQVLASVGIEADSHTESLLREAINVQKTNEQLAKRAEIVDAIIHVEDLRKKGIGTLLDQMIKEGAVADYTSAALGDFSGMTTELTGKDEALAAATERYNRILNELINAERRDEAAKRAQAAAAFALTLAQNSLNAAASAYVQRQAGAIDTQIENLQEAGPSARTRQLERQLQRAQNAGAGSGNQAALRNIAEERQLILLRQRLRLMGANINLERYSGKFLLEAINAKIAALQKEAAAQDRLNRLLDIQYRLNQGVKRQAGETINEFLERRAQEGRALLSEQRQLEQEAVIARLNELKDATADEVALRELAEQKKTLLAQAGQDARVKALQKELEASKKADAEALKAKLKTLEEQKKALEDAAETALRVSSQEHILELQNYIRMSRTMNDLAKVSGEIRGLEQAQEFLKAILSSGILPPDQDAAVRAALSSISATLKQYNFAFNRLTYGPQIATNIAKAERFGFAEGGYIPLTNASSPFGQNIRFGEQGSEAGLMVLPNRIASAIKGQMGNGIGSMNFYGVPADDMYTWSYKIKDVVKDVIREELRG